MKIKLIIISKNDSKAAEELFSEYIKRLKHYSSVEVIRLKPAGLREEAEMIVSKTEKGYELILLDEEGTEFSSTQFAEFINRKMNVSKNICFVIGSAYGFDDELKKKATQLISLSKMTLPHQLAKVIFIEQLYRAFTILKNEKYHH